VLGLAWPAAVSTTTGLVVGGQIRSGRKVKSSLEIGEFERKETQQDENITVEYSCRQPALPEKAHK